MKKTLVGMIITICVSLTTILNVAGSQTPITYHKYNLTGLIPDNPVAYDITSSTFLELVQRSAEYYLYRLLYDLRKLAAFFTNSPNSVPNVTINSSGIQKKWGSNFHYVINAPNSFKRLREITKFMREFVSSLKIAFEVFFESEKEPEISNVRPENIFDMFTVKKVRAP